MATSRPTKPPAGKAAQTKAPQGKTPQTKAEQKRARVAAAKAAAAAAERRARTVRMGLVGGAVLVVIALVVVGVLVLGGHKKTTSATGPVPTAPATAASGRDSNPPWPAPTNAAAAVAAAGLPMLGEEGTALHIHAHLDVIVNGQPVQVPSEIGIDQQKQQISPLHTHDGTGIIHVESPTQADFSLGQFMSEWQVSLSATNLGGLKVDDTHQLKAYVDGQPYTGDPAGIILKAHQEIALVYGTAAQQTNVPGTYNFPSGY